MSLRPAIKLLVSRFLYGTGFLGAFLKTQRKGRLCVLAYHRVGNEDDPVYLCTPEDHFDRQLEVLNAHFRIRPLSEALEELKRGNSGPLAAITFDDGYLDNYIEAYPLLLRHDVPSSVFLTCDYADQKIVPWPEILKAALMNPAAEEIDLNAFGLGRFVLTSKGDRIVALNKLLHLLKGVSEEKKARVMEFIGAESHYTPPSGRLMMNWEEIRIMLDGGVSFGSHTLSHPILTRISKEEVLRELATSKRVIEGRIDREIDFLAYPNGQPEDFDESVKVSARAAGYKGAFTTIHGWNGPGMDPFEIRRFTIHGAVARRSDGRFSSAMFLAYISGIWALLGKRKPS